MTTLYAPTAGTNYARLATAQTWKYIALNARQNYK